MIPTLEQVLASPETVVMAGGTHPVFFSPSEGMVYKYFSSEKDHVLRRFKSKTANWLKQRMRLFAPIDISLNTCPPEEEAAILLAWHDAGIPTVPVSEYGPCALAMHYVDAKPFSEVLQGEHMQRPFECLIATLRAIRSFAKERNDPRFLHTDLHTRNFLWDERQERAIAIDPLPNRVREKVPFNVVDAIMNIHFLYHLDATLPNGVVYAERYVASLDVSERYSLLEHHKIDYHLLLPFRVYALVSNGNAAEFSRALSADRIRRIGNVIRDAL